MATGTGDESGLTNMLGYGDANSSRGDISFGEDSVGPEESTPECGCSAQQEVSTPRRQSHRPGPRRHSPQITTPILNENTDENASPEYTISFTPGKTKLNTQSLLALQRKFGIQNGVAESTERNPPQRGLKPSDSHRNSKEGSNESPVKGISIVKKAPSILKNTEMGGTPRASLVPRPTGSNTSFKRKVVVSFANSPVVRKGDDSRGLAPSGLDASIAEADPQTPSNTNRRVMAGHTPGYVRPEFNMSAVSEDESTADNRSSLKDGSYEPNEEMSNLVTSFADDGPMSPEASPPTKLINTVTASKDQDDDLFCQDVSTICRPPSARAQEYSRTLCLLDSDKDDLKNTKVETVRNADRASKNDSATPSTLFYSSSGSEDIISRENTPASCAVSLSRPASMLSRPQYLLAHVDTMPTPATTAKDISILSVESSPLDFSQSDTPDFYKSIGLDRLDTALGRVDGPNPILDYNSEFLTCPSSQVETAQRNRGVGPMSSFSCIGSPARTAPKLSRPGLGIYKKNAPQQTMDATAAPKPAQEFISNEKNEAEEFVLKISKIDVLSKEAGPLPLIQAEKCNLSNGEVSLSRPGLRRSRGHDLAGVAEACIAGGCLSSADKKKAVPYMMSSVDGNEPLTAPSTVTILSTYEQINTSTPASVERCDVVGEVNNSDADTASDNLSNTALAERIDIDAVCKDVIQELYEDGNSIIIPALHILNSRDVDASSCIGLNDLMQSVPTGEEKPLQCVNSNKIERANRRRVATPSTCSSGWSLGTTVASRVPINTYSVSKDCGGFCLDNDEDAPLYYVDEMNIKDLHSPLAVRYSKQNQNDSFVSQNTMTTVAVDDDLYGDGVNDDDNVAKLCFTSRPWQSAHASSARRNLSLRSSEDVKEILLFGRVGYTTSISISFRNKRSRGTVLQARAILHRYEPTGFAVGCTDAAPSDTFRAISESAGDHYGTVDIAPDDKVNITVEFSPFREGIYSGVLKIRSKKKAFVLLLRGEASLDIESRAPIEHDTKEDIFENKNCAALEDQAEDELLPIWNEKGPSCIKTPSCELSYESDELQRQSLRRWLRSKLDADSFNTGREKLKETYDKARYIRLLSLKSPVAGSDQNARITAARVSDLLVPDIKGNTVAEATLDLTEGNVYFRKEAINFGVTAAGSILRLKIELCNSTDKEVHVHLGDPVLPFIVLHNEIIVPAHSFVRIPVRFVPVYKGIFASTLYGQILNTEDTVVSIQFSGRAV